MAWKWTATKEKAAWLVAEARLTLEEICQELSIGNVTLYRWKRILAFQDKVEGHLAFINRITQMNHARIQSLVTRRTIELLQSSGVGIRELTELLKLYLPHRVEGEVKHNLEQSSEKDLDSLIKSFHAGYDTGKAEGSKRDSRKVKTKVS